MSRRAGSLIRQGSRNGLGIGAVKFGNKSAKALHIQRAVNDINKTASSFDDVEQAKQVSWLSSMLVWGKTSRLVAFSEHVMVLNALYTMMSTSIHLGFKVRGSRRWEAVDMVSEVFFMFDIVLHFCTAIDRDEKKATFRLGGLTEADEDLNLHVIALKYLKERLLVDIVNAIPFYAIISIHWPAHFKQETPDTFLPMGMQVVLLIRMMVCNTIRLNDGSTYVRNYQALHGHLGSNPKLQRMVELSVIFFFLAHYVACIFFRIAIEEGLNLNEWTQPLQKGWDDVAGMPDDISRGEADDPSYKLTLKYWSAMSAALTSMAGNAVIKPKTIPGALFQSCIIIVYFVLSASLIATFTSLISEMDSTETARNRQIDGVQDYLRSRQAPASITNKILAYYQYLWKTGQSGYNTTLLSDLPQKLRLELDLMLKRGLLENVPLFKLVSPAGLVALVQCLSTCIVLPDEMVISQGDGADCMFFLVHGTVQVEVDGGNDEVLVVQTLAPGAYFGELALLDIKYTDDGEMITGKRSSSVRAVVLSELQVLSVAHFLVISADFPDLRKALEHVAKKRQAYTKNAKAPNSALRRNSSERGGMRNGSSRGLGQQNSPGGGGRESKNGEGKGEGEGEGEGKHRRGSVEERKRKLKAKLKKVGSTVMQVNRMEKAKPRKKQNEDEFHAKAIRVVQAQSVRIADGLRTISSQQQSEMAHRTPSTRNFDLQESRRTKIMTEDDTSMMASAASEAGSSKPAQEGAGTAEGQH